MPGSVPAPDSTGFIATLARHLDAPPRTGTVRVCRAVAFGLDLLILYFLLSAIGYFFFAFFCRLGVGGFPLGAGLAWLYFALPEWGALGGRSLGKRMLGLEVIRPDGESLSPGRSALRTFVALVPVFLYIVFRYHRWADADLSTVRLWAALALGTALLDAVHLVFDRRGGRALHDRLCRTEVMDAGVTGPVANPRSGRWLLLPAALAALAGAALLARADLIPPKRVFYPSAPEIEAAYRAREDVRQAEVYVVFPGEYEVGHVGDGFAQAILELNRFPELLEHRQKEAAATLLRQAPGAARLPVIHIHLRYGYDLGLCRLYTLRKASQTPRSWLNNLGVSPEQWLERHGLPPLEEAGTAPAPPGPAPVPR